jgi:hypothetical protein
VFEAEDLDGFLVFINPVVNQIVSVNEFQDAAPLFTLDPRYGIESRLNARSRRLEPSFFAASGFSAATCLTMLMMSLSALLEKMTVYINL